jgi:hypothetical protein
MQGFATALSPLNLLFATIGCILGTLIGVLPGISPAGAIAMLLPFTFGIDVTTAIEWAKENDLIGKVVRIPSDILKHPKYEFMIANFAHYKRICHFKYMPLPGGDTAIRKPARTALAYLWTIDHNWEPEYSPVAAICAEERLILKSQLEKELIHRLPQVLEGCLTL